jgi:hypothetical protein
VTLDGEVSDGPMHGAVALDLCIAPSHRFDGVEAGRRAHSVRSHRARRGRSADCLGFDRR